jgi:crotonobetainyl-CoA:carnitine CoA-transferase CaiB-like acyl-CoA transferase
MANLAESEQLEARGYFVEMKHPEAGKLKYPGAPAKLSKTPWRTDRHAPLLGEHNAEVYCRRLGYSKEELVGLRRAGVV